MALKESSMSSSVISSCRETQRQLNLPEVAPRLFAAVFDRYPHRLRNQPRSGRPTLCDTKTWTDETFPCSEGKEAQRERGHVLRLRLLLSEDPEDKVRLFVGLEGGGDHQVLPGGQAEARAHLAQVDEGLGASAGRVAQKEVFL